MAKLDSGSLDLLNRALRLTAPAPQVELDDNVVGLTMDVGQLASASSPALRNRGQFQIIIDLTHSVANTSGVVLEPYTAGTFSTSLTDLLEQLDIWLIAAAVDVPSATLNSVALLMTPSADEPPFVSDGSTATTGSIALAFWNAATTVFTKSFGHGPNGTLIPLNFRMPRDTSGLRLEYDSSGAGTARLKILAELVPPGLRPSAS